MAFLHPSTRCSQCHAWGHCHLPHRKAGSPIMVAHHLRLGSRPLLPVHMLPFTAKKWISDKGSHCVTNDQLLLVGVWCLRCRNKVLPPESSVLGLLHSFQLSGPDILPIAPLHAHSAPSLGPEIPPPAQAGSSIRQCGTSCWLSVWPAPQRLSKNSHGRTLLSKEGRPLKALWRYMLPHECLVLVWLPPMCRFISFLKNLCYYFPFFPQARHVLERLPYDMDQPSRNSVGRPDNTAVGEINLLDPHYGCQRESTICVSKSGIGRGSWIFLFRCLLVVYFVH